MKKSVSLLMFVVASSATAVAFACPGGEGHGKGRADVNKDGKVSLQEALDAAKQRFEKKDADKSGTLTKNEMGRPGMFDMLDANKDGKVTLAEAQAKAREWFTQADKNKDGFITKDEKRHAHGRGHAKKS